MTRIALFIRFILISVLVTYCSLALAANVDKYFTDGEFVIQNVAVLDGLGNEPHSPAQAHLL